MGRACLPPALFVLVSAVCACSGAGASATEPAAVLFVVDTLRADHLHCYGYGRHTSPHLDRFAGSSRLFEQAHSQSTWTKPSTASILTGLHPSEHHADKESAAMPAAVTTLAERLRGAGVRTGSFFANTWLLEKQGLQQGFEVSRFVPRETPDRSFAVVDAALEFIAASRGEPFFAYVHIVDPHHPYEPAEPFRSDALETDEPDWTPPLGSVPGLSDEELRAAVDLYDGEVRAADAAFGRLLDGLEALGLRDRCSVLFTADHGEELGSHGGLHHGPTLLEELIHIPLVIRRAGDQTPGRVPTLAQQIDLAPTILPWFGVSVPADLPGVDLLSPSAREASRARYVISEVDSGGFARKSVLRGGLKYIRTSAPTPGEQLFDLRDDPGERVDRSQTYPERAAQHRELLEDFLDRSATGLFALVRNGGTRERVVECILIHGPSNPSVRGMYTEEMGRDRAGRDGFPQVFERDWEGERMRGTRVLLRVSPGDTDGIHMLPDPDFHGHYQLLLRADGSTLDPELVWLGSTGRHPDRLPLDVTPPFPEVLLADGSSASGPVEDGTLRVHVWARATNRESVQYDEDEVEAFRALGYMGGD